MSSPRSDERPEIARLLDELHVLLANVTPHDEHLVVNRYDHGGGRMYRDTTPVRFGDGGRTLILDAYQEGDREFYFNAVRLFRELDAALRASQGGRPTCCGQTMALVHQLSRCDKCGSLDELASAPSEGVPDEKQA